MAEAQSVESRLVAEEVLGHSTVVMGNTQPKQLIFTLYNSTIKKSSQSTSTCILERTKKTCFPATQQC